MAPIAPAWPLQPLAEASKSSNERAEGSLKSQVLDLRLPCGKLYKYGTLCGAATNLYLKSLRK